MTVSFWSSSKCIFLKSIVRTLVHVITMLWISTNFYQLYSPHQVVISSLPSLSFTSTSGHRRLLLISTLLFLLSHFPSLACSRSEHTDKRALHCQRWFILLRQMSVAYSMLLLFLPHQYSLHTTLEQVEACRQTHIHWNGSKRHAGGVPLQYNVLMGFICVF